MVSRLEITEVDMKTAMECLGLGKVRMRRILGLLFPSAYRPRTENGLSTWRVNRSDVEHYLEIGRHLPIFSIPDESHVDFKHVLKYWAWNGDEIVDLSTLLKTERCSCRVCWIVPRDWAVGSLTRSRFVSGGKDTLRQYPTG